jgi:hypothetical protein
MSPEATEGAVAGRFRDVRPRISTIRPERNQALRRKAASSTQQGADQSHDVRHDRDERAGPGQYGTTQAQWLEAEGWWKDGETAVDIAHRLGVKPSTVNAHMQKRRLRRRDYPTGVRPAAVPVAAVEDAGEGGPPTPPRRARAAGDDPVLDVPEDAGAVEAADALAVYSRDLLRRGRVVDARNASTAARAQLLTEDVRRRVLRLGRPADEADEGPVGPPPVLRDAQRPPLLAEDGGAWRTWLFLGGRGAGKTLAGAA